MGRPGQELASLRKSGVEIQYRIEVPLVTYLGDTTAGNVFDHPDVINAEVLITEATFFDPSHRQRAKVGKHLHIEQLLEILPALHNQHLVLTHVSRRTSVRRARAILKRAVGEERMQNVHFLMDFEGSSDAGDIEEAGPPPSDAAE
jgi:ribonuclease BN (tRNA processing enzyme)